MSNALAPSIFHGNSKRSSCSIKKGNVIKEPGSGWVRDRVQVLNIRLITLHNSLSLSVCLSVCLSYSLTPSHSLSLRLSPSLSLSSPLSFSVTKCPCKRPMRSNIKLVRSLQSDMNKISAPPPPPPRRLFVK